VHHCPARILCAFNAACHPDRCDGGTLDGDTGSGARDNAGISQCRGMVCPLVRVVPVCREARYLAGQTSPGLPGEPLMLSHSLHSGSRDPAYSQGSAVRSVS